MAQNRVANRAQSGSIGKPSTQMFLIELKQRILAALNKLEDRDTQQIAVEDLERIAETLSPDSISLCLSCLYDTDAQQKSAVRKESIKMFGTLASLHDKLLTPHLPKIVVNIVRRLRDPDSSIRDACVEAMGLLAAKVLPLPTSSSESGGAENGGSTPFSGPFGVFMKPLFDALNEQNRSVQVGAAMCLARVINYYRDPPAGALQRICPRIIKNLSSPNFAAKAALLTVIGSIIEAGGATSYQCLTTLMTCVQEALKSPDWATRKAASETLACIASSIGSSSSSFKNSVLNTLESCRFDKVKPVRDSVIRTLQIWKSITNPEADLLAADKMSVLKENAFSESSDGCLPSRKSDALRQAAPVLKNLTPVNSCFQDFENSYGSHHARSAANKITGSIQRKRTALSDKKTNPDFSWKMDKKDTADWQVKVAIPRVYTPLQHEGIDINIVRSQGGSVSQEEKLVHVSGGVDHGSLNEVTNVDTICQKQPELGKQSEKSAGTKIQNQLFEESVGMSTVKNWSSRSKIERMDSWLDPALNDPREGETGSCTIDEFSDTSCNSGSSDGPFTKSSSDYTVIQRQLDQIEIQQSNLLKLLQELMNSSKEKWLGIEARVQGLENVVDHLAQDIATGRCKGGTARYCGRFLGSADFLNSTFMKNNEYGCSLQDSSTSCKTVPFGGKDRHDIPVWVTDPGRNTYVESEFAPAVRTGLDGNESLKTQAKSWRLHVDVSSDALQRRDRDGAEGSLHMNKKGRDRGLYLSRLGEGPSARSIWQSSKDEATLAAIRVAGEDVRVKVMESVKQPATLIGSTVPLVSEALSHKVGGQGKGLFWSLWTRATEFLRTGDTDLAYVEVLCAGDELLLVRLMSRTGPVLEKLTSSTVVALLQIIIQLLLQQIFLDIIIPWIEQVANRVTTVGPDCLGLPLDAKRELVASLHEACCLEFPELWIGKTLDKLALQLANSWGIITPKNGVV